MIILGIDPGLSGALSWLYPDGACHVEDMPTFSVTRNKGKKRHLDLPSLLRMVRERPYDHAFLEAVSAMPKNGAVSSFSFGRSFGASEMMLAALGLPYDMVVPAVWKRVMGFPADKDAARSRASQLLPQHAHLWPLVKHDGRAEASGLALYGRGVVETRTGKLAA